jgi:alpha-galactosidase
MLDGTHPAARSHLTSVFRTMRQEWRCRYFKLDANVWGAIPAGNRYDTNATSVQAYRLGMEAVLEGVEDAFVLGCNAPMWPSLGLVHAMRVANDVARSVRSFTSIARQVFHRSWQHHTLWINDPDCAVIQDGREQILGPDGSYVKQEMPSGEAYSLNATYVLASGGMVFSGDDLTCMDDEKVQTLRALAASSHTSARFHDDCFEQGVIPVDDASHIAVLFNWSSVPAERTIAVASTTRVTDYFTGAELQHDGTQLRVSLCATSAVALRVQSSPDTREGLS